jgi:hypothetical protein
LFDLSLTGHKNILRQKWFYCYTYFRTVAKLESFTATGAAPVATRPPNMRAGPVSTTVDPLTFRSMLNSIRSVAASVASIRDRKALVLFSGGITGGADISTDVISTIDACNKANVAVSACRVAASSAVSARRPRLRSRPWPLAFRYAPQQRH